MEPVFERTRSGKESIGPELQTDAPGFFDQELIPGVKNLYLAGGAAALLLVLMMRKKS
ncbi:MAG: hypothetical protein Q8K67_11255 [Geothrix sp.]|nr:hypothetical protein [Geothrix sp.]